MKTIFRVLILFQTITLCNAQSISFKDVDEAKNGKVRGTYEEYISQDGTIFKIGDVIKIGRPSTKDGMFTNITQGDGIITALERLSESASGSETEIIRLKVLGNKITGYQMYFRTKGVDGITNYTVYIEPALSTGEIGGYGITSQKALEDLKKAKEQLDLELITQVEYDSIKNTLKKYIEIE